MVDRPTVTRRELLRIFGEDRLIAVIRTPTMEAARQAAHQVIEGGVRLVEITLTVPDAFELIAALSSDRAIAGRGVVIGAGTVLSGTQAEDALLAGARFLVSPCLVPDMISACRARDALSIPGTLTPTEMLQAADLGADFIKIYPLATIGGPEYVTNVRRALTQLPLVATGNIAYEEIPAYLAAGVVGFGIGAPLLADGAESARRFLAATRRGA